MAKNRVVITTPKGIELLKSAMFDLGEKAADRVVEIAVQNAPVNTGDYRNNIINEGNGLVVANKQYSAFIEYGTSGDIVPVNKKALHFIKDGKEIFTKRVKQRQPNPVMRNAAAQTQKEINQIWKEALRDNGL